MGPGGVWGWLVVLEEVIEEGSSWIWNVLARNAGVECGFGNMIGFFL